MITTAQLSTIFPRCKNPAQWTQLLNDQLPGAGIISVDQVAHFLSQTGHESAQYNILEENLNYSAEGLVKNFSKYFNPSNVMSYARKPQAIANRVYANRMGNGDEASGDGWKFRGRGLIQLTGKENHLKCSLYIFGDDRLVNDPAKLLLPDIALKSAIWFWITKKLREKNNPLEITNIINGGTNGLEERVALYNRAKSVL